MRKLVVYSILIILCTVANAERKWTLRECINHAVENNISIKQSALEAEGAEIDLNTNRHSRLPNVSAGISQGFSFGQSSVRVADPNDPDKYTDMLQDTKTSSTSFSASTGVTLFAGRMIHNQIQSSKLSLKAATESLNKAKQNLELQVASLYLDLLFQKEILKVYLNEVELTKEQVGRTEILVNGGKVPTSQLYEIKAKLAQDQLNVTEADNRLKLSTLNLAQALNLSDYHSFDIREPAVEAELSSSGETRYSPDEIYQIALDVKPHIKEAIYKLEGSELGVKIAKAAYYPNLSLSAGYNNGFSHVFGETNESVKSQLKKRQNESIGLSLSIPIFNRNATRNRVRSSKLTVRSSELSLENIKLDIFKEIQQAHQSATSAQAKFESTKRALEAAQEAFSYTQERYDVGKATTFELNESQTKLIAAKSQQLQSKYEYIFRNKILDFYRGVEIDIAY